MTEKSIIQPTLNRTNAGQVGFSAFSGVFPSALGKLTSTDGNNESK
jgi:hypothetical protein